MSERRLYLDEGYGERRGVVTLDGRPERLIIEREGDAPVQALGARVVARVRAVERAAGLAFLDLGAGPDAVVNLPSETGPLVVGQVVEVEIRAQARNGKGASARIVGPGEGAPRLLTGPPSLEEQLLSFARGVEEIRTGGVARTMADAAQEEALKTEFGIPGGGSIAVETTRALTAVDVDLGAGAGADAKRATRLANFAALGIAARVLRLKGLGGLVIIDLVGRGHDAPALLSSARAAFGPDNPGVALGPISRFGTLELTIPRRARPTIDILTADSRTVSAMTAALDLVRALEREGAADGGGRFVGLASQDVGEAAGPALAALNARFGARFIVKSEALRVRSAWEVARA